MERSNNTTICAGMCLGMLTMVSRYVIPYISTQQEATSNSYITQHMLVPQIYWPCNSSLHLCRIYHLCILHKQLRTKRHENVVGCLVYGVGRGWGPHIPYTYQLNTTLTSTRSGMESTGRLTGYLQVWETGLWFIENEVRMTSITMRSNVLFVRYRSL